jgi:hypothetical protein
VYTASSYNRGSYDSRYMGPISLSQIRDSQRRCRRHAIVSRVAHDHGAHSLAVLVPALAMNQRSRIAATAVAAAYYGVSSFPVAQISAGYFGRSDVLLAILLWAVAGAILAPGVGWPSVLLIVQAGAGAGGSGD